MRETIAEIMSEFGIYDDVADVIRNLKPQT